MATLAKFACWVVLTDNMARALRLRRGKRAHARFILFRFELKVAGGETNSSHQRTYVTFTNPSVLLVSLMKTKVCMFDFLSKTVFSYQLL